MPCYFLGEVRYCHLLSSTCFEVLFNCLLTFHMAVTSWHVFAVYGYPRIMFRKNVKFDEEIALCTKLSLL